jgi:hypothetical protein
VGQQQDPRVVRFRQQLGAQRQAIKAFDGNALQRLPQKPFPIESHVFHVLPEGFVVRHQVWEGRLSGADGRQPKKIQRNQRQNQQRWPHENHPHGNHPLPQSAARGGTAPE